MVWGQLNDPIVLIKGAVKNLKLVALDFQNLGIFDFLSAPKRTEIKEQVTSFCLVIRNFTEPVKEQKFAELKQMATPQIIF